MNIEYCNRIRQLLYLNQEYYKEKGIIKVEEFLNVIQKSNINPTHLKTLSYQGIPEDILGLKPLIWKVMLSYLVA